GVYVSPLVYSMTFNAPVAVGVSAFPVYFDGANCTGNAFISAGRGPPTNLVFNTGTGMMFQISGAPKTIAEAAEMDNAGVCKANVMLRQGVTPITSTNKPNVTVDL